MSTSFKSLLRLIGSIILIILALIIVVPLILAALGIALPIIGAILGAVFLFILVIIAIISIMVLIFIWRLRRKINREANDDYQQGYTIHFGSDDIFFGQSTEDSNHIRRDVTPDDHHNG